MCLLSTLKQSIRLYLIHSADYHNCTANYYIYLQSKTLAERQEAEWKSETEQVDAQEALCVRVVSSSWYLSNTSRASLLIGHERQGWTDYIVVAKGQGHRDLTPISYLWMW